METYDCLIIDDEQMLTESAAEYFNLLGVRTAGVLGADECRRFLESARARVIVLDISLGDDSGFDLCRELRTRTRAPIVFLSARSSDEDKIAAYTLGGDDYIQKPCSLSVLLAKVRAVLRRQAQDEPALLYDDGYLQIDGKARSVRAGGREISLTALEYRLLTALVHGRDGVLTKQELFEKVWEDPITSDGTLSVHIRRLREQIERDPGRPVYIRTVHGVGYRFVPQ